MVAETKASVRGGRGGQTAGLPDGEKRFVLPVERLDGVLNDVYRQALEQWFATLPATPARYSVPMEMVAVAIDAERRGALHQATPALQALHQGFLSRKSADQ